MNRIILTGRLTRDPELSQTPSGIAVCRFSLAVNRDYKNAEGEYETDFFNVIAWRELGNTCHKYLCKGNKALIEGTVSMRTYDAKDGTKRTAVEVVAGKVEFLEPKTKSGIEPTDKPRKARSIEELEPVEDDGQLPF